MKYALIAGAYGNYFALEAALRDAAAQGAERYLFLGDYIGSCAQGEECLRRIRGLPGAITLLGCREKDLLALPPDPVERIPPEKAALYWTYASLTPDHITWIATLQESTCLEEDGIMLNVSHRFDAFCGPPGVQAYGCGQVQHYAWQEGGLLLCPGSCGLALDGDTRAAYALVTVNQSAVRLEQRRVAYGVEDAVSALRASLLYTAAPALCQVTILCLRTAKDYAGAFFQDVGRSVKGPRGSLLWQTEAARWLSDYRALLW